MGAPTWEQSAGTPTEDLTDDEAERRLLAPFLFSAPENHIQNEEGTHLSATAKRLHAWINMVSERSWALGHADPPSTDGHCIFLPTSLPTPIEPSLDAAAYRCMALLQSDLTVMGFADQRAWMAELHQDWVLRCTSTILMARFITASWKTRFPGTYRDLIDVRASKKYSALRIGSQTVPEEGLPAPFRALLTGLVDDDHAVSWVDKIVAPLSTVDSPIAARLVLAGVAQQLREAFREHRLGAPPIPMWVGALHPSWFLYDEAAELAAAQAWKRGPKPLQALLHKIAQKTIQSKGTMEPERQWVQPPIKMTSKDGIRYDEWDCTAGRYRKNAVRIIEQDAPTGPRDAVNAIRATHRQEIIEIQRRFAELKIEQRWLHGQRDGSEIDVERTVTALTDIQAGQTPSDNLYQRFQRNRTPLAIMTLVDLSGSTNGRILSQEQIAVVLFREALQSLHVSSSFFGFSGEGAQSCRFQRIQDWQDDDIEVDKRMGSLQAHGSSRLGAYVRHATGLLKKRPETQRVLLLLSDGKPEDGDAYRGRYGVHDTAIAVREARKFGIHVHCISLDNGETKYLQTIFGPKGFTCVDDASALPSRLPDVFHSLIR